MGVTQYIGSRYVPVFADPAEWNNTRSYEPLTIVLHEGNSYTSKQYVPKGVDISNADFWAETGNYNSQVEQYRKEVLAFDARIATNTSDIATANSNIRTNTDNIASNTTDICPDVLFIGDSYMEGYSPDGTLKSFAATVKQKLEFSTNRHAHIVCKGGYSFCNGAWLTLLTEWCEQQTEEALKAIGNIYVCGGANDRHNSSSEITDAQKAFFEYCRTKFPNARYTVFFIGACCVGKATYHTDTLNSKFATVVNAYAYNSFVYGYSFVNGSGIIKFNKYFSTDYFHPNQLGQNWLAANLFNIVNGGNQAFTYGEHYPGISLFNGTPDFQNNGDNYKLASSGSTFSLDVYTPNWTDCAGDYPWNGYEISKCNGHLVFDTTGVTQDWSYRTLEICTLPDEAIYQAPTNSPLDIVRQWPVSIQYQVASGKALPDGVDYRTFFTDTGTLFIHGNKVYLHVEFPTQLRGSSESAYLKQPIAQMLFAVVHNVTLPALDDR